MGTLTYSQMTTEVKAALGNRSSFDASRLLNIMNLAQMRIARVHRWEELETLTDTSFTITATPEDDKYIDIPANTRDIQSIRVIISGGQSRKLTRKTSRWMDANIPEPEYYARGKPTIYCRFATKLEVWKIPDSAYRVLIRSSFWPSVFTGSTSQTTDLDNKDDMVIALGINWAFQSLGRGEDAAKWWRIYANMLNDAVGEEVEKPDQVISPDLNGPTGRPGEYWTDPFTRSV